MNNDVLMTLDNQQQQILNKKLTNKLMNNCNVRLINEMGIQENNDIIKYKSLASSGENLNVIGTLSTGTKILPPSTINQNYENNLLDDDSNIIDNILGNATGISKNPIGVSKLSSQLLNNKDQRMLKCQEDHRKRMEPHEILDISMDKDVDKDRQKEKEISRPDSLGIGKRYISRSTKSSSDSGPSPSFLPSRIRNKSPSKSPIKMNPSFTNQMSANSTSPIPTTLSTLNTNRPMGIPVTYSKINSTKSFPMTSSFTESSSTSIVNGSSPLKTSVMTSPQQISQPVRTTKTSRLRAALDKQRARDDISQRQRTPSSDEAIRPIEDSNRRYKQTATTTSSPLNKIISSPSKRLVPSIAVSVNQTLSEFSKQLAVDKTLDQGNVSSFLTITSPRARTSTMIKEDGNLPNDLGISPVFSSVAKSRHERDKSSKRKSNLNRSLNEESTQEVDLVSRRRRALRMSRPLISGEESMAIIKKTIFPLDSNIIENMKNYEEEFIKHNSPKLSKEATSRRSLIARKDSHDKRRSHTLSPRHYQSQIDSLKTVSKPYEKNVLSDSEIKSSKFNKYILKSPIVERSTDKANSPDYSSFVPSSSSEKNNYSQIPDSKDSDYLRKNKRLLFIHNGWKERTKSELAKIEKMTTRCNKIVPSPTLSSKLETNRSAQKSLVKNSLLMKNSISGSTSDINDAPKTEIFKSNLPIRSGSSSNVLDSLQILNFEIKYLDLISKPLDNGNEFEEKLNRIILQCDKGIASLTVNESESTNKNNAIENNLNTSPFAVLNNINSQLPSSIEAVDIDNDISCDSFSAFKKSNVSPILRRKSSEEQQAPIAQNHIVSILKKKDTNDSSSSSNASPVTFSSSVLDTPTRSLARQGILKKRSSLDESRYSRSQSPDERGILVRNPRRNSLEEIQHGILKQSSYESKTEPTSNQEPHGILKKKETPTPSEQHKHVSIAEAVLLAAAELCKDIALSDHNNYDVRPILKSDTPVFNTPRPILKKKYSSETEEIRPILKSSRKSSREENSSDTDDCIRSILKIDSPAKRFSYTNPLDNMVFQRSRSLETHETKNEILPVVINTTEKPLISVAERIKNMETFLGSNTGLGAEPKKTASTKRDLYRERFKTQPVTGDEYSSVFEKLNISQSTQNLNLNKLPSLYLNSECSNSQMTTTNSLDLNSATTISGDSGVNKTLSEESESIGIDSLKMDTDKSLNFFNKTDEIDDKLNDCDITIDTDGNKKDLHRSNSVRDRAKALENIYTRKTEDKPTICANKVSNRFLTQSITLNELNNTRELNLSNTMLSDDSGTEIEPSMLPLSERFRIFSNINSGCTNSRNNYKNHKKMIKNNISVNNESDKIINNNSNILSTTIKRTASTIKSETNGIPKIRTIGKLIMNSFFNKNNKNSDSIEMNKSNKIKMNFDKLNKSDNFQSTNTILTSKFCLENNNKEYNQFNYASGKENYDNNNLNKNNKNILCEEPKNLANTRNNGSINKSLLISSPSFIVNKYSKYFGIDSNQSNDNNNDYDDDSISSSEDYSNTTLDTIEYKEIYDFDEISITESELANAPMGFERLFSGETAITENELANASMDFERKYLELETPTELPNLSVQQPINSDIKGILKSKSGCVGMFPSDLNSELKNRLKKSTNATVSNLCKVTNTNIDTEKLNNNNSNLIKQKKLDDHRSFDYESSSDSDDITPGKNLGKILLNLSKENMHKTIVNKLITPPLLQQTTDAGTSVLTTPPLDYDDAKILVNNLRNFELGLIHDNFDDNKQASTSEGESSGGREISSIIKNSAVGRRKKHNDG